MSPITERINNPESIDKFYDPELESLIKAKLELDESTPTRSINLREGPHVHLAMSVPRVDEFGIRYFEIRMEDNESYRKKNSKKPSPRSQNEQIYIRYYPADSSFVVDLVSKCATRKNYADYLSKPLLDVYKYVNSLKLIDSEKANGKPVKFNIPVFINALLAMERYIPGFDKDNFRKVIVKGDFNERLYICDELLPRIETAINSKELFDAERGFYISKFKSFLQNHTGQSIQEIKNIRLQQRERLVSTPIPTITKLKKKKHGRKFHW